MEANCQEFVRAIREGDCEGAKQAASRLAQSGVRLCIKPEQNLYPNCNIILNVGVVDIATSASMVRVTVTPHMTIAQLKKEAQKIFGFTVDSQLWLLAGRMMKDERSLYSYGVRCDGHVAYLYIKSTRLARKQQPRHSAMSDMEAAAPSSSSTSSTVHVINRRIQEGKEEEESRPKSNWSCRACTFVNEASRPSCTICAKDRLRNVLLPRSLDAEVTAHPSAVRRSLSASHALVQYGCT
uniref:ranBP-type and C3HC4-type zinc finger-containing protein 1-like isoform X2 n=1 Tax=Myxine glutinosa TaxID=7769 RepID=UPI00358F06BE